MSRLARSNARTSKVQVRGPDACCSEQHLDVQHDVYKQRLNSEGLAVAPKEREEDIASNKTKVKDVISAHAGGQAAEDNALQAKTAECGSCYGAEENPGDCCDTCDAVRDAYRKRGCVTLAPAFPPVSPVSPVSCPSHTPSRPPRTPHPPLHLVAPSQTGTDDSSVGERSAYFDA